MALEERRALWRERLAELHPDWSAERWRWAVRAQLLFWIGRGRGCGALPSRFAGMERAPHGLGLRETFAAFFCFEPEDGPAYFEVPFLLAVARGDADAIRDTGAALGLLEEELSPALFTGPFIPRAALPGTEA